MMAMADGASSESTSVPRILSDDVVDKWGDTVDLTVSRLQRGGLRMNTLDMRSTYDLQDPQTEVAPSEVSVRVLAQVLPDHVNAMIFVAAGGSCGTTLGAMVGFCCGVAQIPMTLGLSLPVGTGLGAMTGGTLGCATGFAAASSGLRLGIKDDTHTVVLPDEGETAIELVKPALRVALLSKNGREVGGIDKQAKTMAYACAGSVAFGSVGAASGSAIGCVIGAGLGLPLALCTFGLSVPFTAMAGGSVGLCTGSVVGGGSGFVAGSWIGKKLS